jgi:6-phosphogluconolactonase
MKFRKFGKALLVSALSGGVILGVTSCVRSYTVGYLYVTGTVTSQSNGNGIISGYRIDHNTGFLTPINGLPVSSGGANPGRAVLTTGSRYVFVLNQGVNASGGATCTTSDPCSSSNISQFSVGGNGNLTPQSTFYTQGINPFRLVIDTSGSYLMVLDHDAPDSASYTGKTPTVASPNSCMRALGNTVTSCGDITIFKIDSTTGRLTLVQNAQVTAANGAYLTYFPVPANPIDFTLNSGYVLTLSGTSTTGDSVFPYSYNSSTGQLTLSQNSAQSLGIYNGTAIVVASGVIYVLDNESLTITSSSSFTNGTYPGQILPYTVGSSGSLSAQTSGAVPIYSTQSNPIYLMEATAGSNKYLYVANQGNNTTGTNANSGITAYTLYTSPSFQLSFLASGSETTFGTGSGPQCIVEDPSNQYIYTANFYDSTITGRAVDVNDGVLNSLRVASSYKLQGPANWCLVNGRTD